MSRSLWRFMLTAVMSAMFALPAAAQTVTVPSRVAVGCDFTYKDAARNLTSHFLSGDRTAFRAHAAAVIAKAASSCAASLGINPDEDVVQLLWVDEDPLKRDPMVYRALVQKDDDDPASSVLPGVGGSRRMFEIFVSPTARDAVASIYTSTRQRGPLEEQAPAFAQAVLDPLSALLASTQGTLRMRAVIQSTPATPPPPPPHYATISRIVLPFARAAVHVEVIVAVVPDAAGIRESVEKLSAANRFTTGAHSQCALRLDEALAEAVSENAATCAATPGDCAATLMEPFLTKYQASLALCGSDSDRKELLAVDAAYRSFVTELRSKVAGQFELRNSPRRLVSFGLMTAFVVKGGPAGDAIRVTLNDDGNLTPDPLGRQLNLVVVNVGFKRYNADAFHPTRAERFQWFAGAVVTPDFGLAAGLSAGIVRGLTVNVGGAIIGVRGLREGDSLDGAPGDPQDPFKLARATVAFLGVGYTFK